MSIDDDNEEYLAPRIHFQYNQDNGFDPTVASTSLQASSQRGTNNNCNYNNNDRQHLYSNDQFTPTDGNVSWCDPRHRAHSITALLLVSLLSFGSYFCYDNPAALEAQIENDLSISTSQFSTLYSYYSWPNIFMCYFGGYLIDKVMGIRLGTILFLLLLFSGQLLFAIGAFSGYFSLMQFGRFVFGLGGESLQIAQNTYIVTWFKGKELNTVFGLQVGVARLSGLLSMNLIKPLYEQLQQTRRFTGQAVLGYTLMIPAAICLFSLLCGTILALLDRRAARILNRPDIRTGENASLSHVKLFPVQFWLLTGLCVCFYFTIFPFVALGTRFFAYKWELSGAKANGADSVVYIVSAISSPIMGIFVDMYGRNLSFLFVACIMVLFCHLSLATTFINLWIPLIGIGIGYSILCSALWPLVAQIVPDNQLGSAYGAMQAFQNFGLAVLANVAGMVVDWKGYIMLELFFVLWLTVSIMMCIFLFFIDQSTGGSLNLSAKKRKQMFGSTMLIEQ